MISLLFGFFFGVAPQPLTSTPVLVASVETRDIHQLFGEYARDQGWSGAESKLACKVLAGPLTLCLKAEDQGKRRYVTQADLETWQLDEVQAHAQAAKILEQSPWVVVQIEGGGHYFQAKTAPGHESTVFLHPEWLVDLGETPRIAAPARGVVVAWPDGDEELDRIMAVGVRKMSDELPERLSPMVLSWNGQAWVAWGQAKTKGTK
ncbi:MAG: hypothetical protein ACI9VR_001334 [Cognaticolwellia sp.]|jgi:hypothetical protein